MSTSPTYSLDVVRQLLRRGSFRLTERARLDGLALGFDDAQIAAVVEALRPGDFYKTMPARQMPGLMQDVYRPTVGSLKLYVKIQIRLGTRGELMAIISFKEL